MTGLAHKTIRAGIADLDDDELALSGRVRRPGGGRTAEVIKDPELINDLRALVKDATRGDPSRRCCGSAAACATSQTR